MVRRIVVIVVACTVIGALMPARRAPAATEARAEAAAVKSDWGSAATPLEGDVGRSAEPIRLVRRSDGHFYADALVNQATIHFLVDTGASGIALSSADAKLAQVATDGPSEVVGRGASGDVIGREVRLDRVRLGSQQKHDVNAIVIDGGDQSLLGQSFLAEFESVEISNGVMTLR